MLQYEFTSAAIHFSSPLHGLSAEDVVDDLVVNAVVVSVIVVVEKSLLGPVIWIVDSWLE